MAPSLTSVDCLRLQHYVTLPGILGGSVAPNPRFWPRLVRKQSAAKTIKFFLGLQKKYGRRAWSWFPFGRTLLVLDGAGINEVLTCHENFADPFIKKLQLSAFTPHGAIISRPLPWQGRRALNDEALAFGQSCHPDGELFAAIVHDEVKKMLEETPEVLAWDDFSTLAARISQQVIFGIGQYREDVAMNLARLVNASNWGVIRRPADFSALHGCIDEKVDRRARLCSESHSLVQRAVSAAAIETTDVETSSQIAFWLFVMKDAIELHTVRTLALIASAPENVRQRLSDELACTRLTAAGIARLDFLEACIKEALRLWTPVPILLRVALDSTELSDNVPHREGPANPHAHRVISSGPGGIWRRRRHVPPGTTADRGNARLLSGDTRQSSALRVQPTSAIMLGSVSHRLPAESSLGLAAGQDEPSSCWASRFRWTRCRRRSIISQYDSGEIDRCPAY